LDARPHVARKLRRYEWDQSPMAPGERKRLRGRRSQWLIP